jgi:hypothetical protein
MGKKFKQLCTITADNKEWLLRPLRGARPSAHLLGTTLAFLFFCNWGLNYD